MTATVRSARLAAAALVLAAAASLGACNLQISNQAEARSEWKKEFTLAAGGTLEIRNTNGLIEVEPSEGTQVTVTAERIAKGRTDADAKQAAEAIEIIESVTGSSITLDARASLTSLLGGNRQVKFRVRAPKGTMLTLTNTNGAIDVRDMTGELRLDTTNGRIRGINISGTTRAESTNGEVDLSYTALGDGGVNAETTNGRVVVTVPTATKARVNVRVTNGGINTENLSIDVSEQTRKRLSGTINGGGPEIRLETTNGGVSLRGK
jgi:DUF4097 and DUF4098 domain-containing protein YvlB